MVVFSYSSILIISSVAVQNANVKPIVSMSKKATMKTTRNAHKSSVKGKF